MDYETMQTVLLEQLAQRAGDMFDHFSEVGMEPREAAIETVRQVARIYAEETGSVIRFLLSGPGA